MTTQPALHRLSLLCGETGITAFEKARVIVFGLGGVGSWCAEALVRSGIGHITLVDSDVVCVTNINRQLQAEPSTVGQSKTDVLVARLKRINPRAEIIGINAIFSEETAEQFKLDSFDYVIDAIDSLKNKVELIIRAHAANSIVFTALGASNRLDSSRIKIASLWKSDKCPFGKLVRKRLRQRGFREEVTCIFSDEIREPCLCDSVCGTTACMCPRSTNTTEKAHEWCSSKKQINGSAVHVTGIFGFMLAGLVISDIHSRSAQAST